MCLRRDTQPNHSNTLKKDTIKQISKIKMTIAKLLKLFKRKKKKHTKKKKKNKKRYKYKKRTYRKKKIGVRQNHRPF